MSEYGNHSQLYHRVWHCQAIRELFPNSDIMSNEIRLHIAKIPNCRKNSTSQHSLYSLITSAFAVLNVFDDKSYVIASAVSELYALTMMSLVGYLTHYLAWQKEKDLADSY